jgi:hypothetical protein
MFLFLPTESTGPTCTCARATLEEGFAWQVARKRKARNFTKVTVDPWLLCPGLDEAADPSI